MKVSELIEQAKQILEKHGDIKITTHTPGESEFHPAVALTFCVLKKSTLKWGWSDGDKIAVLILARG